MNRRSFLRAMGIGSSATALTGCGLDDNRYYTPVEKLLPYVTHPVQTTPGNPSYFATCVGRGPSAWPVVAVHREGRVVNVGANQVANAKGPMGSDPRYRYRAERAVAPTQFFELQRQYSPDRIAGPMLDGVDTPWEEATKTLTDAVVAAKAAGKAVAFLGPYHSATLPVLLDLVTEGNAVFWEPLGLENEALASKALLESDSLPRYDLSKARYVLSFGAPFLGDAWGGPGHAADFARGRDANEGRFVTRFAAVTPMRDQTAGNADDWYPCNPGTEAQVALAVAKIVARKRQYSGPGQEIVMRGGDPTSAAQASGLTVAQIESLADAFLKGGGVALPGGLSGASARGTQLAAATYLLNIVAGARDLFLSGGYAGPVHAYSDVAKLIADMSAGRVGVLLMGDLDASFVLPKAAKFAEALQNVDLSVALTSHPNETTSKVKLILPTHSVLEDWGDEEPMQGFRVVRQPGMSPLLDTRSMGDVLLDCWRATDAENAPTGDWRDYLMRRWSADVFGPQVRGVGVDETVAELVAVPPEPGPEFLRWWEGVLGDGFFASRGGGTPLRPTGVMQEQRGSGELPGGNEYALVVYPHPFLVDGRYANEPWAQETPDPMTGHVWDTWALVHPNTAARLGVSDNHMLRIETDAGSVDVGVEVHPCVKENVIAVPLGGGHTEASGRYAAGVGANIIDALGVVTDPWGGIAWQQSTCRASSINRPGDLHSTFGVYPRDYAPGSPLTDDSDSHRGFAVLVNAEEWADGGGDDVKGKPGKLTGLHHIQLDPRLKAQGVTGFYPMPDHPTYRFGMTVDTNACNGCGACTIACYAENNLPVVGKEKVKQGREMNWLRVNRYFKDQEGSETPSVHFVPMMCQQCGHAPCESVCPVLATYHTIDGLNAMVYNRCVGTRYCSNACPYSARKFNYHTYVWPEPFNLQLNPDVVTRTMGVMEKCTFCVQRIRRAKSAYRDRGFTRPVPDQVLEQLPACAEACPSQAITFGNLNDEESGPSKARKSPRTYEPIADVNTYPAVNYLARASFHFELEHHGGHGDEHHGDGEEHNNNAAPHGADGH